MSLFARASQSDTLKLHDIFCTYYLWPWLGPPLTTMQYVMYSTSGFVDDVMFAHNEVYGAWLKPWFHIKIKLF